MTTETIRNETARYHLSEARANLKVKLLDISPWIVKPLLRAGINTLGELLATDYSDIAKIRNLGEKRLAELKGCVHSLGYTLLNEEPSLKEQGDLTNQQGLTTPRNANYSRRTVSHIRRTLGLVLDVNNQLVVTPTPSSCSNEDLDLNNLVMQNYQAENNRLKLRIEKKEALLEQYQQLILERNELLAREQHLQVQLEEALKVLEKGGDKVYEHRR